MQVSRDDIPSSPPQGPPSFPSSPRHGSTPPSPSQGPTRETTVQHRKRPSEDLTHFAQQVGRANKLRKTDQDQLNAVAKWTPAEQRIWLSAKMLKFEEGQEALNPPDALYKIPKRMLEKIDRLSFTMIMDPKIAVYIDGTSPDGVVKKGPVNALWKMIQEHASWGYTPDIAEDSHKTSVIMKQVRGKFTNRRSALKLAIDASMGDKKNKQGKVMGAKNIVDLTKIAIDLYKTANIKLTIQLCVRIAMLRRSAAMKDPKLTFWEHVDHELEQNRKMEPSKQSRFLAKVLARDRELYGESPDLDSLNAAPTRNANTPSSSPSSPESPTAEIDELEGDFDDE